MPGSSYDRDAVTEWVRSLYANGVDRKDADAFAAAFTEDGWLRFGNNEPLVGHEAIRSAIAGFFTLFASLAHEETGITWSDETVVTEANVTYTLFSGSTVTVPACTIYRLAPAREGEPILARRCQVYVDLSPLFGALQTAVA